MSKKTKDFTDGELSAYSDKHLLYEIRMVVECAKLMACRVASEDPGTAWAFSNSRVEAFAIHLRNIVDFLYPRRDTPQDTDVTAFAYLPASGAYTPISDSLKAARGRADKEVGHLTTSRRDDDDPGKPWHLQLLPELFCVLLEFVQLASPEKLGVAVRDYVLKTGRRVDLNG